MSLTCFWKYWKNFSSRGSSFMPDHYLLIRPATVLLQMSEGLTAMRLATGFVAAPLLIGVVTTFSLQAQPPTFEVASIKPAKPGQIGTTSNVGSGSTLILKNYALKHLVMRAYDVPEFQVSGASGWMGSETYDIVATADRAEFE